MVNLCSTCHNPMDCSTPGFLRHVLNHALIELTSASLEAQMVKNLPATAGGIKDVGSFPGSGRSPGERNSYPLKYSCLKNSKDRGSLWATVHGVKKSWTRLSDSQFRLQS